MAKKRLTVLLPPAEHTPGPWTIAKKKAHPWVVECNTTFRGIKNTVVECSFKPNAHLIAAGPDMLAALRLVQKGIRSKNIKDATLITMRKGQADLQPLSAIIDAAIAKAITA